MTDEFEAIVTRIPGPRSLALAAALARTETRGVTYLGRDFPVFWESADGALVNDVDGNRYIDCTAAFGVATTGHANPAVAHAIAEQASLLPHGMGDVHPTEAKTRLLERLAALAPLDEPKTFLCSTGGEAVEFALKSAYLAVRGPNVLAFEGGYHGLGYGALEVCGVARFREPWRAQLRDTTTFAVFPDPRRSRSLEQSLDAVAQQLKQNATIGAVVVEPIQGRAGVIVPPDGFLPGLRGLCTRYGVLLILDEIYTGFGRTGSLFACEREAVRPDVLCVGKALGGGFPISATILSGEVAKAWQPSTGEALHTSTYLGNPMGCAAALANLDEIERRNIPRLARERERPIARALHALQSAQPAIVDVRGRGMLWAIEFTDASYASACVVQALARGLILLQSGIGGEAVTFAPPPVITEVQLERAFALLAEVVRDPVLA